MRRELKEISSEVVKEVQQRGHKAYPDEKGTESVARDTDVLFRGCHKAYPDEKGTERLMLSSFSSFLQVTRHIPMRRELKVMRRSMASPPYCSVTRHIPMRRELKVVHSI